ncbi:MAG: FAD-dependent oxidoreductase [Roseiarcus sp.]
MSNERTFKRLLEPIRIRNLKIKNRIVKPPFVVDFANPDGSVGDCIKDHEALARGGVGMIVVETTAVDYPLGVSGVPRLLLTDDKFIPGFARLTKAIHKYDCTAFLQLQHAGPAHPQIVGNSQPVASSSLSDKEKPRPSLDTARELTIPEIEDLVQLWAAAAVRARKAGFDGVELHFCHDYLVNSFLSAAWNKRQDEYGAQNLENRTRFAVEILREVRKRCGEDYPIGVRMNGWEWGVDKGLTIEESTAIAKVMEQSGADHLHVSGWGYHDLEWLLWPEQIQYPQTARDAVAVANLIERPGALVPPAEAIKRAVSIPVVAVGRLNPALGEWILETGKADLIALGRSLAADPDLPNKIASGRYDEVRPCTACLVCFDAFWKSEHPRCQVNATWGKERDYEVTPAVKKKKVVVVGGGPAGMEAARVAATRGHEVTLYEKSRELGGRMQLASLLKGSEVEDLPGLVSYFRTQLAKLGVEVKLGAEVSAATVVEANPDAVVLATGGIPAIPAIPGIDRPNVLPIWSLAHDATAFLAPFGKRVVVMGGLVEGSEAARLLTKHGRQVIIAEPSQQIGTGIPDFNRIRLLSWFEKHGVTLRTGIRYEEINDEGLIVSSKEGKKETLSADTILVATPLAQHAGLAMNLQGKAPEVHVIGDAKGPALIVDAIEAGWSLARSI